MSTELVIKGFFALLMSGAFAYTVFSRQDTESGEQDETSERYLPYISGLLLPLCLLTVTLFAFIYLGREAAAEMMLSFSFGIFLHIALYYALLLLLLPLFRRFISARACAMLWLIPNYLYYTQFSYMEVPVPLLVLRAPEGIVKGLFLLWAAGFAAVLLWHVISHLVFRRRILRHAVPVTDEAALSLWQKELADARVKKPKMRLVRSDAVKTPLSVGICKRSIRVVLPQREYTEQELSLIFRHELIHICREDAASKFFFAFCCAMCWFNPLMWRAMRNSADDMELSCDETVLLGCDSDERRLYAELLLRTAGDERGFTSCLSASARALRYRLGRIMKPGKRKSGALAVGLAFFILCMSCGYVSLAYDSTTGKEAVFGGDPSSFSLRYLAETGDPFQTEYDLSDPAALSDYLSQLRLEKITGNYSFTEEGRRITCLYDTPNGTLGLSFSDRVLRVTPLYRERVTDSYYLPEGIDWAAVDAAVPAFPALNVSLWTVKDAHSNRISGKLVAVNDISTGEQLYDCGDSELDLHGTFGHQLPLSGQLVFSKQPRRFSMTVETMDRTSHYTMTEQDFAEDLSFTLPQYPAHYTVSAVYGQDGKETEAVFRFTVGLADQ
ncbi:MAG: peptidase M56 [Clostridia bacterium]|nr:peptidase M56 [Clostridia bacterium]